MGPNRLTGDPEHIGREAQAFLLMQGLRLQQNYPPGNDPILGALFTVLPETLQPDGPPEFSQFRDLVFDRVTSRIRTPSQGGIGISPATAISVIRTSVFADHIKRGDLPADPVNPAAWRNSLTRMANDPDPARMDDLRIFLSHDSHTNLRERAGFVEVLRQLYGGEERDLLNVGCSVQLMERQIIFKSELPMLLPAIVHTDRAVKQGYRRALRADAIAGSFVGTDTVHVLTDPYISLLSLAALQPSKELMNAQFMEVRQALLGRDHDRIHFALADTPGHPDDFDANYPDTQFHDRVWCMVLEWVKSEAEVEQMLSDRNRLQPDGNDIVRGFVMRDSYDPTRLYTIDEWHKPSSEFRTYLRHGRRVDPAGIWRLVGSSPSSRDQTITIRDDAIIHKGRETTLAQLLAEYASS